MKKITVILTAVLCGALGTASPVFAQDTGEPPTTPPLVATPELCAESDTAPSVCDDVTFDDDGNAIYPPAVEPPVPTPPPTDPGTTTTTIGPSVAPPTTVPPGTLPSTGSSGTSGFLQIGALILTAGLLVVVAARRRTTARPAAI